MTAYLNIGSNQGDRHANLKRAVALIVDAWRDCKVRTSDIIESEPWGFDSPHGFLNIGVAIDGFTGSPHALLRSLQAIEKSISATPHRNADGSYADRIIDIDIIEIDGVAMSTPSLTLPHPRAHLRHFVTIPLEQLKKNPRD